jgi:protease-4
MKKFLLGLVCGLVLAFLTAAIFVFALVRLADRTPTVSDNSVLMLRLEGDIPERAPVEIPLPMFDSESKLTVRDLWSILKRASTDSPVKAVVIAPRGLSIGWAKADEIRESLASFKKSGKPVYALLRSPGMREYLLATVADRIYTSPEDRVDVKGLRLEAMYFANTLNKLGVSMEVVHAGKYKDAYDMFTRTSMSPETREVLNGILDEFYAKLTNTISVSRKKTPEEVRALIDKGPFVPADALAAGLVDVLGYEDQLFGDLKTRVKSGDLKRLDPKEYLKAAPATMEGRTKIALVVAEGAILQGSKEEFGNENIVSGPFARLLRRVKSDSTIKGVIVRVDSPGGDATASDDILYEMKELSRSKPVVISMSDYAASGGYYMSATGDPIIAYPTTLTGSIGVITAKPNLHGLYDKLGITKEILTRGHFAALDSDYTKLTDEERSKMNETAESIYRGFMQRVAAARKQTPQQVAAVAEGRVWLGDQAKDRGLVDQLGGIDAAIELVRQKAKIAASDRIALVPYPSRRSLFDLLMSSRSDESAMAEAKISATLARLPGGRWVRPLLDGGALAVMPYFVDVR